MITGRRGEKQLGSLVLISGANDSGKSAFAEKLIGEMNGKRYYIATMIPNTEENRLRIDKHRLQREKYGFSTLELPYLVADAPLVSDSVVLLEDVSNLLANNMFEKDSGAECVLDDILKLRTQCRALVVVTISGLVRDGYDEKTAEYIDGLNSINQKLFDEANIVISMKNKCPVYQKGEMNDII